MAITAYSRTKFYPDTVGRCWGPCDTESETTLPDKPFQVRWFVFSDPESPGLTLKQVGDLDIAAPWIPTTEGQAPDNSLIAEEWIRYCKLAIDFRGNEVIAGWENKGGVDTVKLWWTTSGSVETLTTWTGQSPLPFYNGLLTRDAAREVVVFYLKTGTDATKIYMRRESESFAVENEIQTGLNRNFTKLLEVDTGASKSTRTTLSIWAQDEDGQVIELQSSGYSGQQSSTNVWYTPDCGVHSDVSGLTSHLQDMRIVKLPSGISLIEDWFAYDLQNPVANSLNGGAGEWGGPWVFAGTTTPSVLTSKVNGASTEVSNVLKMSDMEMARLHGIAAASWDTMRIGVRLRMVGPEGTNPNGLNLGLFLCNGTADIYPSVSVNHAMGIEITPGQFQEGIDTNDNKHRYNGSGTPYMQFFAQVGAVRAPVNNNTTQFLRFAKNNPFDPNDNWTSLLIVEFTKLTKTGNLGTSFSADSIYDKGSVNGVRDSVTREVVSAALQETTMASALTYIQANSNGSYTRYTDALLDNGSVGVDESTNGEFTAVGMRWDSDAITIDLIEMMIYAI